jgi:phosphatidate phosphatase APP1
MMVIGHLYVHSPVVEEKYHRGVIKNARSLLRMFAIKTAPSGISITVRLGEESVECRTVADGFFMAEWKPQQDLQPGWHGVTAEVTRNPRVSGEGKLYVPRPGGFAFISDIDDTFLISHSADLVRRLKVLFTRNPRTRKPFEGVVAHYQLLALANTTPDKPNPFFYVSSSEWNLYEYIKEFCRFHGMPEGIFLLSEIKTLSSFLNTGQGKHGGKFFRIRRIIEEFPEHRYVLLGDDSQKDPEIYEEVCTKFPGMIEAVYIRHRVKEHIAQTRRHEAAMKAMGVEVCYFTHSSTARMHWENRVKKVDKVAG